MTPIVKYNYQMKEEKLFSAVFLGNYTYVFMQRLFYRFDCGMDKAKWERLKDLDGCHGSSPSVVAASGYIYAVGSRLEKSKRTSVSKYDPSLNRWEELKNKTLVTKDSAVVASGGYIYSIGGYIEEINKNTKRARDVETNRVERMDLASEAWHEVAPTNKKRSSAAAVAYKESIVVAGSESYSNSKSVEQYDPVREKWTTIGSLTEGRSSLRLHFIEENIFAVGGDYRKRTAEKYNNLNDLWEGIDLESVGKLFKRSHSEIQIVESVAITPYTLGDN